MSNIISLHSDGYYRKKAQELFEEGMRFVSLKKYKEAKENFEKASEFDKENLEYKFYAGVANYILDEFLQAETYLKEAVKEKPFNIEYHYTYGIVLYRLKKIEKAKSIFELILEHDQTHLDAMFYLAKTCSLEARNDEAIAILETIIAIEPNRYEAYFELGCVYLTIYQLEIAEKWYIKSMKINSKYAIVYYYLSKVYLKRGEHDRAIDILKKLKQECPEEAGLVDKNIKVIETLKSI